MKTIAKEFVEQREDSSVLTFCKENPD